MEGPAFPDWKRAVLKVGSALVAPDGRGCSTTHMLTVAQFVVEAHARGREVVLVSSGAVAAGRATRPARATAGSIPEKQALAAIGQPLLMAHWSRLFDAPCAQILLSYDDLAHRPRFVNARNTLRTLLDMGALPVVNENDTVAVEELRVGDNDNLAAHVAVLAGADLLVICTDIDGLYDADPRANPDARRLAVVPRIDARVHAMAGGAHDRSATGGMRTKLQAAEKATARGIDTVIVNGTRPDHLRGLHEGVVRGTHFPRADAPLGSRKHWMLHAMPSRGRVHVDDGAARALCERGASLLPSGVLAVEGAFEPGAAVEIVAARDGAPAVIAKGIARYGARELERIRGCHSTDIAPVLGFARTAFVIGRDDLVVLPA